MTDVVEFVMQRQWDAAQRGALSTWTIFEHPLDYPHGWVARRFESVKGNPEPVATTDVLVSPVLEPLRETMMRAGLTVIERMEDDQPQIVEVWI